MKNSTARESALESASLKKLFLIAIGFAAAIIPFLFVPVNATSARTQSQSQAASAAPPEFEFEVASIKPGKSWDEGWVLSPTSDGLAGKNVPLVYLIQSAYGIYEKDRLIGAPSWAASEFYNIDAKMDAPTAEAFHKLGKDQRKLASEQMLQALLADRFKLAARRETKELPVYFLVVGKNGPKLPEAKPDPNGPNDAFWGGPGMRDGIVSTTAHNMTTEGLANYLTGPMSRTVLDKTGLTGAYEFTLRYTPDNAPQPPSGGADAPSLSTALQEQLGLKLEPGKGPVEIIVIDHVERPSGN